MIANQITALLPQTFTAAFQAFDLDMARVGGNLKKTITANYSGKFI
ncbi:MAG: hypothetical protein WBI40_09130 [Methylococcaceae bacterium]